MLRHFRARRPYLDELTSYRRMLLTAEARLSPDTTSSSNAGQQFTGSWEIRKASAEFRSLGIALAHVHFAAGTHLVEFCPERFVYFFPFGSLPHTPIARHRAGPAVVGRVRCPREISPRLFIFALFDCAAR